MNQHRSQPKAARIKDTPMRLMVFCVRAALYGGGWPAWVPGTPAYAARRRDIPGWFGAEATS